MYAHTSFTADMVGSLPDISLREKVLLWLAHVEAYGGDNPGLASTQAGIAEATGLSRGHVSRTVAPLLKGGLLAEERRRVPGFSRVLKAYRITPAGRIEHDALTETLYQSLVPVREAGADRGPMTLRAVVDEGIAGRGLWPALAQVLEHGFVDRAAKREVAPVGFRWVRDLDDGPPARDFQGRRDELAAVEEWVRGPHGLLVVEAAGGMGKTSLVRQALQSVDPRRHLFWVGLTEWMTGSQLMDRLDQCLTQLGRPPRGSFDEQDVEGVRQHVGSRVRDLPCILILDDHQKAPPPLRRTVEGLMRLARGGPGLKLIIIGRSTSTPPDITRRIERLRVGPIEDRAAHQILGAHGVPAAARPELALAAHGNPLFLHLLARRGASEQPSADLYDYLARDLAADLADEEREVLHWSSALRVPVAAEFWERIGIGSPAVLAALKEASLLKERDDGRFEMHDLLRESFYKRLGYEERARIHAHLAQAFRPRERDWTQVAEYLHHLVRAGRRDEAVQWVLNNRTRLMEQASRLFHQEPILREADPGMPQRHR